MACKCAPALLTARDELNAVFPSRDKGSDGCCGDAAHQARKSDHNPTNGYAHAFDYDEDVTSTLGDQELQGMALILLADPRTKMLIYEAQALYPDGTVKPYTGVNAHRSHLHHSIKTSATHDTRPWGIARAFQQEDDMAAAGDEILSILKGPYTEALTEIRVNLRKVLGTDFVDEDAIAAEVLSGLDPKAIAAAIPAGLAEQVADELAERLKG